MGVIAGINLNPYQGLKREGLIPNSCASSRRNQPKSLSGIETKYVLGAQDFDEGRNQPKSLSGIETQLALACQWPLVSRNQPKSLSGIETKKQGDMAPKKLLAGINLNPYQGLKQHGNLLQDVAVSAGINLNPYQGLKLCHYSQLVKR